MSDPYMRTPPPAPITAAEARAARLQEIDGTILDIECHCGRSVMPSVKMLLRRYSGQHRLGEVVKRIVCEQCRGRPAAVYLTENGIREFCYGGRPGWSVQVWPMNNFDGDQQSG